MAEGVVDQLEVVQVEVEQRRGLLDPSAHGDGMRRDRVEAAPVGQAGELIHGRERERFQLLLQHPGEVLEHAGVLLADLARLVIDDAERAQGAAVGSLHRASGVEADLGEVDDERMVAEAIVTRRVGHDQHVVAIERLRAEAELRRRFARVEAEPRLDPLAVRAREPEQRDGRIEEPLGEPGQTVESLVGTGSEEVEVMETANTLRLVLGGWSIGHELGGLGVMVLTLRSSLTRKS